MYIGLMSGTSADAIDAVLVSFDPCLTLHASHSIPLKGELRDRVLALTQPGPNELDRMGMLDRELGIAFAEAALSLLELAGMPASAVQAIGSHGQTVRHRPDGRLGFSLQIADPNTIAELTGIPVVADFRRRDVAAGGQGAPLVPAFHRAVFGSDVINRTILNIGGMANISYLPAASHHAFGFDTGPGNVLMDAWSELRRGLSFDAGGLWARQGQPDATLLEQLLAHDYFHQRPPKSTGRELFHLGWLRQHLDEQCETDVQRTLLELTARSIAEAIRRWAPETAEVYTCGGGAFNDFLMERLSALMPERPLSTTLALGLDPRWVEASAFAWLARQTMRQRPGNLPETTGASGLRILGGVYYP